MKSAVKSTLKELRSQANPEIARQQMRFFKTGPGDYGEGDVFLGLKAAQIRSISKPLARAWNIDTLDALDVLLHSKYHEARMTGLLTLVELMTLALKGKAPMTPSTIYGYYIEQFQFINNWDLVDCSSHYVVGRYLVDGERAPLYLWVRSEHMWTRRIAIVSQWWFIRQSDLSEVFSLVELTLNNTEDLMHKASGWMLREAGKKDEKALLAFLDKHTKHMPRTMLRYAIEKLTRQQRQHYLSL